MESTNENSVPALPKVALVTVITVAVVSCLAIVLCSGVITGSAIRREVGGRRHRRRRRIRARQRQQGRGPQGGHQRRLPFAMRANEAYEVTPHQSSTTLGQEPSYLESASDVYYEDITPFVTRTSQTATTSM